MNRRKFIKNTFAALGALSVSESIVSCALFDGGHFRKFKLPDSVEIETETGRHSPVYCKDSGSYKCGEIELFVAVSDKKTEFSLKSPRENPKFVFITWNVSNSAASKYLNDHWERGYGDLHWGGLGEKRVFPWYFAEYDGTVCNCVGVMTQCNSFCSWIVSPDRLVLKADVRNGSNGVRLGGRVLEMASVVARNGKVSESPFDAIHNFCKEMCPNPRLPKQSVYGINDWYFAYGKNSEKLILELTDLVGDLIPRNDNKPFCLIDGGWNKISSKHPRSRGGWSDDFRKSNELFPDMKSLADEIKRRGMRPGLWMRPLCAPDNASEEILLSPNAHANNPQNYRYLDPTIRRNRDYIKECFAAYSAWGIEMIKHDYSSYDIFGKWGFEMFASADMTRGDWSFYDKTKTNAEVVLDLYRLIRRECGDMYVIGCNTFSHLSAGLFELQRTGDDTSGLEWARTLKMGVNTLAFRAPQHNAFYSCDADCVGLRVDIKWELNRQWMELLAESGMPLFISPQPKAVGAEQRECIKKCFELASKTLPTGRALDWFETLTPQKWKLNGKIRTFNWKA